MQFALFFILLLVYLAKGEVSPHWGMLLLCVPLVLQVGLLGLGCGIIVSSLTTRYRDLMVVVTFGVQLWMYGSPVVYPLSMITHPVLRAGCLLYTSDAADDHLCVDLGGCRIIQKKKPNYAYHIRTTLPQTKDLTP